MLGNMGIAEWGIILFITLFLFGGPLAVLIILLVTRRRTPAPMPPPPYTAPTASDQAQMQRILDSLERMERRIENLESQMDQRPEQ